MIQKNELQERVNARKQAITDEETRLSDALGAVRNFIDDIKGRSAIYAMVKNLPFWKKLEALIGGDFNAD